METVGAVVEWETKTVAVHPPEQRFMVVVLATAMRITVGASTPLGRQTNIPATWTP